MVRGNTLLCQTLPVSTLFNTGKSLFDSSDGGLRWADQILKCTQMSLSDAVTATHDIPSWRSIVGDATCPVTQAPYLIPENEDSCPPETRIIDAQVTSMHLILHVLRQRSWYDNAFASKYDTVLDR